MSRKKHRDARVPFGSNAHLQDVMARGQMKILERVMRERPDVRLIPLSDGTFGVRQRDKAYVDLVIQQLADEEWDALKAEQNFTDTELNVAKAQATKMFGAY